MTDAPYSELTDLELFVAMREWGEHVGTSSGWSAAYNAAIECRSIEIEARKRGLDIVNSWKIEVT